MKKLLIALPLVAGAAVAGTSHYAGSQTENEYQLLLQQLNDLSPLVFMNESYENGLGSSMAITKVMVGSDASAEVLFRLRHDIRHAAVRMDDTGLKLGTVSINTTLHDKASLPADLLAAFTDDNPVSLMTDVRLDGQIQNALTVSGIEMSKEGESFSWSGMNMDAVTQNKATVGSGSMGSLSFKDDNVGGSMTVEDSRFAIDVQDLGDSIYAGTGDLTFNNISVMNPAAMPMPVKIASIKFDSTNDREGDAMNGKSSFTISGIDSPMPLKNASLDVEVEGVLMEGLRQYNAIIQAISTDTEALMADSQMAAKIGEALQAMVEPGSAMTYSLALSNEEGDIKANMRIGVKDATTDGMSVDSLKNIVTGRDLLNVLAVNGQLDADTAALAQTPVMMMLGGAGEFLTVTDESITSSVELNGTTLVINGVEMPLDMMTGGMLDVPFSDLLQM